jgi:hypothetical protein
MNSWDEFNALLRKIFQPINEGQKVLTPEEFWNQYGTQIGQLDFDILADKLTELGNGIWSPKPYEALRILSNLRQRRKMSDGHPNDGRALVERVRVEVEARRRPKFDVSKESLTGVKGEIARIGGKDNYSRFQVEGWWRTDHALSNRTGLMVVAPTGAGKTEVFLLPLVASIAKTLKEQPSQVPHYVLVYPRVALLKDQLSRVFKYSFSASSEYFSGQPTLLGNKSHNHKNPIVIGLQYGGIRSERNTTFQDTNIFDQERFLTVSNCPVCEKGQLIRRNAKQDIVPLQCNNDVCQAVFHVTLGRNDLEKVKPHILVTTIESLDRLYLNPKIETYLKNLDALIFDEVHLYYSLYGAHVSNIIRRVEKIQEQGKPLAKIASSATVSNPERFAAKLFYGDENNQVYLHDANDKVYPSESGGLEVLIFLRSPEGEDSPPPQATLLQAAMAMGHSVLGPEDRTILFTESVDHVNRTSLQLRDAEQEQELWRFRTVVDEIEFRGLRCPHSSAHECSIYRTGKCWRGVQGGGECVQYDRLREQAMRIIEVSSKNPNDVANGHDIVIATASLEVGVDDPNFRATIHYRPPLNVFSFIQRRGRAGRRHNDIAYTIMVLGNDAVDEFYFRRRNRLIDGKHYELPLNPQNTIIRSMHDRLEIEKNQIEELNIRYSNLSKSILLWMLGKYRQCSTLQRLFGPTLNEIYNQTLIARTQPQINYQETRFRNWIAQQHAQFKQYLNLEIMLQELEAKIPMQDQEQVTRLRNLLEQHRMGEDKTEQIRQLALSIMTSLSNLMLEPGLDERNKGEYIQLHSTTREIATSYRLPTSLNVTSKEILSLHQFFTVLNEQFSGQYANHTLRYAPQAIPLTLQSLFYVGTTCLVNGYCPSCLDYYIPDSYFQEVKPILVQTVNPNQPDNYEIIAEDSTKLASMLTAYKPFFRYFNEGGAMAILVTEHHRDRVKLSDTGGIEVGIRLRAEGIHHEGGLTPRRIFVKPIHSDSQGKNVVRLCTSCYRLHDEYHLQPCTCGERLTPVRLQPEPLVERSANISESERIADTFYFAQHMQGQTIISGSQVGYTRMVWSGEEYQSTGEQYHFNAIYQDMVGNPEPLRYTIQTRGIIWNLKSAVESLLKDSDLANFLKKQNKLFEPRNILHTAAHMLYKAIAYLSGVSEQVLEYAISLDEQKVVVWERYEGGVGLSEIIRDTIREEPKNLYRELLYSVLCPVHYSQQVRSSVFEDRQLQRNLAEKWALAEDDELLESVIVEAKAERLALENSQAEAEAGCIDGCPACVHISMCTERSEQSQIVSLAIAEKIMLYFRREVSREQLDSINAIRLTEGISLVPQLQVDTIRETFDVVCF